jgi:2-methylaconitate cis-trans-isomerase PrpF
MTQLRIPAVFMRGGSSKGVFFKADDLPQDQNQEVPMRMGAN